MSALWGEMKVTARTPLPHARKQSIDSAISQDVKPCRALLPSIDVCCSVSGPPRFVTLIACQGRSARGVIERHGGMQGGEGREWVSKHEVGVA